MVDRNSSWMCFSASIISADEVDPLGKRGGEFGLVDSADENDEEEEVLLIDIIPGL